MKCSTKGLFTSYVWMTKKTHQVELGYISCERYVFLTDYKKEIITKLFPIVFRCFRCFSQGGTSESPRVLVRMYIPGSHLKFTKLQSLREGWECAFSQALPPPRNADNIREINRLKYFPKLLIQSSVL